MFYYRYRSGSELAIKELIYDELYFASREGCNDPYEGQIFAKLEGDSKRIDSLIRSALKPYLNNVLEYLVKRIVDFYVQKAPLYVDEFLDIAKHGLKSLGNDEYEKQILGNMSTAIIQYVSLYLPTEQYFASFSRRNDNFLMWSHYANNHKGFCLIFRAINGGIYQSQNWTRNRTSFEVDDTVIPHISLTVPKIFDIQDVAYMKEPTCVDGFMFFPPSVAGDKYSEEEMENFRYEYSRTYLQKHQVWDYEEESRAVLTGGAPWITGCRAVIPAYQRLLHYESTQLAGIVLGANMSDSQRNKIKNIVEEKVSRWYNSADGERTITNFVLFEARLSVTNREVIPEPVEIYDGITVVRKDHEDFDKLYKAWKDGEALHFSGTKCSKIQIK